MTDNRRAALSFLVWAVIAVGMTGVACGPRNPVTQDEAAALASNYNANIIMETDLRGPIYTRAYARLVKPGVVWRSSGRDETAVVQSASRDGARRLLCDHMRPGVMRADGSGASQSD